MEIKSVGQIMGLGKGAEVTGVKGKIKVIFDPKTGTNAQGDWSIQGFVLADGKDELIVSLKNREELDPKLKGKMIWIIAHHKTGKQGGISGLKMDEYNGKPQLSVTASAEIAQNYGAQDGAPGPENVPTGETPPEDADYLPTKEKAPATSKSETSAQPATAPKVATHGAVIQKVIDLQLHYARRVNCLRMAADNTLRLTRSFCEAHGVPFDEPMFVQAIAGHLTETAFTTLFIGARMLGMVDDMPSGDIDKLLSEAKETMAKAKQDTTEAVKAAKAKKAVEMLAEANRLAAEAAPSESPKEDHPDNEDDVPF